MSSSNPARDAMALALDFDNPQKALELASELAEWFGVAKVGLELFTAGGPQVIKDLQAAGFKVFADLKLHDIPNTVRKAAYQLGKLGVSYTTLHAAGGAEMLTAGVEGLQAGAADASKAQSTEAHSSATQPAALAVTVLTSTALSDPAELQRLLTQRARLANQSGCAGVICAAADIATIDTASENTASDTGNETAELESPNKQKRLLKVVPGVRPTGTSTDDQARVATPAEAITAGADLLVIGRAVTAAPDPTKAALAVSEEIKMTLKVVDASVGTVRI